MSIGQGWWIDQNGEVLSIYDHLSAIENDPRRFGFSPEELLPLNGEGGKKNRMLRRRRILSEAILRGFIRVRFDNHRHVMEFYGWARCEKLIAGFLSKEGFAQSGIELILLDHEDETERKLKVMESL